MRASGRSAVWVAAKQGSREREGGEGVLGVTLRDRTSQGHIGLLHLNGSQLRA